VSCLSLNKIKAIRIIAAVQSVMEVVSMYLVENKLDDIFILCMETTMRIKIPPYQ
jgi:hypothetical protein